MDWLSKRKFVIVCHEKVVRIPLEGDEILQVHGERTQGVVKTLMNTKHGVHLKLVLELLRKEKLYAKFTKSEAVKNWEVPTTPNPEYMISLRDWQIVMDDLPSGLLAYAADMLETDWICVLLSYLSTRIDNVNLCMEGNVGDIRFGKKGKLAPRYVGPFEIHERISPVAYRLRLPEELSGVHEHAKLLAVRYLVKVSWNSKGNFELTWVWEDYLKDKYPRLIVWLVKPLVLTYESVVMYGLCVYMRYVDCVRVGNQSIERDRLIGIGLVMDLVKFLSFTFGGKEMTFVVLAFLR
ncbi:hypothetical protein Tco_1459482 [Tanacetum coccineum]